jgi:hypothetical protein
VPTGILRRFAVLAAAAALCGLGAAMPAAASATAPAGGRTTVPGVASLTAITCPTATTCVAVGSNGDFDGQSTTIDATTGQPKPWSGTLANDSLDAVACPGKTTCLSVTDDAIASVEVSTAALKQTAKLPVPSSGIWALGAIACAGPKTCYAVGFEGTEAASSAVVVKLSAAGKVAKTSKESGSGMAAIACPSSKTCLIADHVKPTEFIRPLTNGKLGAGHKLPANTYVERISCFGAKLCYALSGKISGETAITDEMIPLNPKTGQPGKAISLGSVNGDGVACFSSTQCIVVGYTGAGSSARAVSLVVSKGRAGKLTHYSIASGSFSAVGCATAKRCYAVGESAGAAIVDKV